MKIIINPKNLVSDDNWQYFRKVRAIIENDNGDIAISVEGGKCIFPGGKCENNEDELDAIKRELAEEVGISFNDSDLHKVLELETFYDDFYDFRSGLIRPRHTITTYYYVRTDESIHKDKLRLTEGELRQHFKVSFMDKKRLFDMVMADHSRMENGKFFDEENQIVIKRILKLKR